MGDEMSFLSMITSREIFVGVLLMEIRYGVKKY
jgi:hypothetical protein